MSRHNAGRRPLERRVTDRNADGYEQSIVSGLRDELKPKLLICPYEWCNLRLPVASVFGERFPCR
jgi:hypothetical protein